MKSAALKRAKSGQPWTIEDHTKLVKMFRDGMESRLLSKRLQRSTGAILSRLWQLEMLDIKRDRYIRVDTGRVYHRFVLED